MYRKIIMGNIGEDTALDPFIQAKGLHGRLIVALGCLFRKGQRRELLPFLPVGKFAFQFRTFDMAQEIVHTALQESNILII